MFDWTSYVMYMVATGGSPGAGNLMSMSNASRVGFRKAYPFVAGVGAAFVTVSLLAAIFCSVLAEWLPAIQTPLTVVGAAYMLYLAWKILHASVNVSEKDSATTFLAGYVMQMLNPKLYVYAIVGMQSYVLPVYQHNWGALLGLGLVLGLNGVFFSTCWAAFGSVFQLLFSKYQRATSIIMALLLVYCAISLF